MLVSTGASTIEEIRTTVGWMGEWEAEFALLHCVSSYPTPLEEANLCWITELGAEFGVPVGHSDHTTVLLAGPLAVAAGATIIEKHLTYDCAALGPDHEASFDPGQFAEYVKLIRQAERMQPSARARLAASLADEVAAFVSPLPATDAETLVRAVVAVRREREYAALRLEDDRVAGLVARTPAGPRGFPQR